jgi:hypothetical protein
VREKEREREREERERKKRERELKQKQEGKGSERKGAMTLSEMTINITTFSTIRNKMRHSA